MPASQSDDRNRDDQQKPGSPPRPATEPAGGGAKTSKTATDPATGAPNREAPEPNQAA
ncbi:hypothetical protein [Phenylobacterium immobile]|uniref:hypothetical protein n=1 Tax=Phenylobacterium immobile TaxID=21 RepID=UPI000A7635D6|nr:hypothetical protein [Phenylobacterium immobile]